MITCNQTFKEWDDGFTLTETAPSGNLCVGGYDQCWTPTQQPRAHIDLHQDDEVLGRFHLNNFADWWARATLFNGGSFSPERVKPARVRLCRGDEAWKAAQERDPVEMSRWIIPTADGSQSLVILVTDLVNPLSLQEALVAHYFLERHTQERIERAVALQVGSDTEAGHRIRAALAFNYYPYR